MAEQCDQLQGVQIFTTTDEGWGGFASEYALSLKDEYPKTELLTWGIERGERVAIVSSKMLSCWLLSDLKQANRNTRTLALANVLNTLMPLSSLYVPLISPPLHLPPNDIEVDSSSEWHKSALLSAAVETVTLPTRLKVPVSSCKLTDVTTTLNPSDSRKISLLSMTVPRNHSSNAPVNAVTSEQNVDLSWTGGQEKHIFSDFKVSRGISVDSVSNRQEARTPQAMPG